MAAPSSQPPFRVFISHAGEDKETIALPLRDLLQANGVIAFVDEKDIPRGSDATNAMLSAMQTADIGVMVLSPEFVARKWPIKELRHFLKRRDEAQVISEDNTFPIILPVFYRLSISELYHEPRLDRKDANGKSLYRASRFYERMDNGEPEADIPTIKAALRRLHGIMGQRNDIGATNDDTQDMTERRRTIIEQTCHSILKILGQELTRPKCDVRVPGMQEDSFCPYFHVEYGASDLVLNFDGRDADGVACTVETRLLDAVLDNSPNHHNLITIQGIGGVGKTSMLRKLSTLEPVKQYFKDGIYFISLGMDARLNYLTHQLRKAVQQSRGVQLSRRIQNEKEWEDNVQCLRSWFQGKRCLFLIDDIWQVADISSAIVHDLLSLHVTGLGSKLVCTTRSPAIASNGTCFSLKPKDPYASESREILTQYAGVTPKEGNEEDTRAVNRILALCAGLPLFLAVAGKTVRSLNLRTGGEGCVAYHVYCSSIHEDMQRMLNTDVDSYKRLYTTLSVSIKLLEEETKRASFGFRLRLTMSEMHKRLCVAKKQSRIPMQMLRNLWELDNSAQAAIIAREFEELGLVDMELDTVNNTYVEWLRLHDSLHLFAVQEARRLETIAECHDNLLNRYAAFDSEPGGMEERKTRWWSQRLEVDGYIHRNLCYHFAEAGRVTELIELLKTPEWLTRQVEVNDIFVVDEDFAVCLQAVRKANRREVLHEEPLLTLIREALNLSAGFIAQNPRELWFQLYGRLLGQKESCTGIEEFLKRGENKARVRWARSVNSFLTEPGTSTKAIIPIGKVTACMTVLKTDDSAALGCHDGSIVTVKLKLGAIEREWPAHNSRVNDIAYGKEGNRLVSGSEDGTLKVWDLENYACVATFQLQSDYNQKVAVIGDGSHIISSSMTRSIHVWNLDTGEAVAEPFGLHLARLRWCGQISSRNHVMLFEEDSSDSSEESSLPDKDIVYGLVWNVSTGSKMGSPFSWHCDSRRLSHNLEVLGVMPDGREFVTCDSTDIDNVGITVWSAETGKAVCAIRPFFESAVSCFDVSPDGGRMVAGFVDGTICVWDIVRYPNSDPQYDLCRLFRDGIGTGVTAVLLQDNDELLSCAWDGQIRKRSLLDQHRKTEYQFLDRETGWPLGVDRFTGKPLQEEVTKVAFTQDGKLAVVGTSSGYLKVWNASSGLQFTPFLLEGFDARIAKIAVIPDGHRVACAYVSETRGFVGVILWDLIKEDRLWQVGRDFPSPATCYAFTPKGDHLICGYEDGSIRVWHLAVRDGFPTSFTLRGHHAAVRCMFTCVEGRRIISISVKTHTSLVPERSFWFQAEVCVWDIQTRELLKQVKEEKGFPGARKYWEGHAPTLIGQETKVAIYRGHSLSASSVRVNQGRILLKERGEVQVVLGTLEAEVGDWKLSPDQRTLCIGLTNGQTALVRIETPTVVVTG